MATDDLNAPLGLRKKQAQSRLPPYAAPVAAGLLGVVLVTFAMWALFNNDPLGGEPMATIKIDLTADAGPPPERKPLVATKAENPPPARPAVPPPGEARPKPRDQTPEKAENGPQEMAGRKEQIVTIIDGKSGARQEVRIPSSTERELAR